MPTFKLIGKDGGVFEWLGLESEVSISSRMNEIEVPFLLQGVNLIKDKLKTILAPSKSTYKFTQNRYWSLSRKRTNFRFLR